MLDFLLQPLADFIIYFISSFSYAGIFIAMTLQSACIPIPSEIILPFSGFFVSQGIFDFWPAVLAAVLGGLAGSGLTFSLGYFKGEGFVRNLIKKFGKFILVFEYELDEAEEWFRKYGEIITFVSRILPVVRTFIALPAGISRMSFSKFFVFVAAGDFLWSALLIYLGSVLVNNWAQLNHYFHQFDLIIILAGLAVGVCYIKHKLTKHRKRKKQRSNRG